MTNKTYPAIYCPQCKKNWGVDMAWSDNPYRPFCCERCKLIDLGAWANDEYRIASQESAHPLSEEEI